MEVGRCKLLSSHHFSTITKYPKLRQTTQYDRVSNLKYESVRIYFKAVVFIRANPGKKKPQTDRFRMSILFRNSALFRKW